MKSISRRKFIQGTALYGLTACLLASNTAFAEWPASIFEKERNDDVLTGLFGHENIEKSEKIQITAPQIAENGAVVPVSIKTDLHNVESVSILVDKNPRPLAAQFFISNGNKGNISARIKLRDTSNITAIIKADGKLYSASQNVKVTIGGCGGGGVGE